MQEVIAYDIRKAAEAVSLSHWSLRRYIAQGRLRPSKAAGKILITKRELERFLGSGNGRDGKEGR